MYECQEVSNTALHNFPPTTGLKSKKLEMRTKIKEKSLTPAGFEPTTSGSRTPSLNQLSYEARLSHAVIKIIISSRSSSRTLKQSD